MSSHPMEGNANYYYNYSTVSALDFRIITTLRHTLFNAQDAESEEPASSPRALIRQWKEIGRNLFALHTRRLREAADAFGWADVAARLSFPGEGGDGHALTPSEVEEPFNLELLVERKVASAAAAAGGTSQRVHPSQGPRAGFLRDFRVRVLISRDGEVNVECTPMGEDQPLSTLACSIDMYTSCPFTPSMSVPVQEEQESAVAAAPPPPPPPPAACRVTLDAQHTATSLFTRHKTTVRTAYDEARARCVPPLLPTTPPTAREVLLRNSRGEATEASLSTVYFLRGGRWVTPRSECGGMQSVTKLYALAAGWCAEATLPVDDVQDGEVVWLSNAVRGFFPGVVKLRG